MAQLKSQYGDIDIDKIELDLKNPRIARIIEMYGAHVTAEAISMALGGGTDDTRNASNTTFASLKESIKTSGGIIHPIILNKVEEDKYIVVEGNTRLQIYRDFKNENASGDWTKIRAVVYENLSDERIHAIRLQSHLVGPRDWDPYSKAKYLHYLHSEEQLTLHQIVDFCGGNRNEVLKYINAYIDMEQYYRPQLGEYDFDPKKFSAFVELQNGKILKALQDHAFTKSDFAKWIIDEKVFPLNKVRALPQVLSNPTAKAKFIASNIIEASKLLETPSLLGLLLKDASLDQLCSELISKIAKAPYSYLKSIREKESFADKKEIILDANEQLKELCQDIEVDG